MANNDEDRQVRAVLGEDSVTGTFRFMAYIVAALVIAAALFWWLDRQDHAVAKEAGAPMSFRMR